VEASAVDTLAAFDGGAETFLDNWRGYGPDGRKHAVSAMLAQRNRIAMLLSAVEGSQVERSALDAAARSHLYDDPDPAVSAKARALLESTNSDRSKVVASYHDVVNLPGDVTRGKTLFQENCARCHEPRRQGGRIGPDLSGINNKTGKS
jgi:cytochrome c553